MRTSGGYRRPRDGVSALEYAIMLVLGVTAVSVLLLVMLAS